jgi:hypothetical protein
MSVVMTVVGYYIGLVGRCGDEYIYIIPRPSRDRRKSALKQGIRYREAMAPVLAEITAAMIRVNGATPTRIHLSVGRHFKPIEIIQRLIKREFPDAWVTPRRQVETAMKTAFETETILSGREW